MKKENVMNKLNGDSALRKRMLYSTILCTLICFTTAILAQEPEPEIPEPSPSPPRSLKGIPIPKVKGLDQFVKNKRLAVVLGKALFWDMQVGSDSLAGGRGNPIGQSCASCHFLAGADPRSTHQLSPGLLGGNNKFDPTRSGGGGLNYTMKSSDFPFHVRSDPDERDSSVVFDTDDVMSSQGVFLSKFEDVDPPDTPGAPTNPDVCEPKKDPTWTRDGLLTRRVEPRNTPTVINAIFNFRNFWDGRANSEFNGVDPFGPRNKDAFVLKRSSNGSIRKAKVWRLLNNSSLASQAVGPPLSNFEMSCDGRIFPKLGQKLLHPNVKPLANQLVSPNDSVLSPYVDPNNPKGLTISYKELIMDAFKDRWWASIETFDANGGDAPFETAEEAEESSGTRRTASQDSGKILRDADFVPAGTEFTQMEFNFSLFFGLAIQLYESTLVSDETPFDKWRDGDSSALTGSQKRGLDVFLNKGKCINCHSTPLFTKASSVHLVPEDEEEGLVERILMGDQDRGPALYDNGFYNISTRPTKEDIGVGGKDPFGNPLSFTRQYIKILLGENVPDSFEIDPCTFEVRFSPDSAGDLEGDGLDDPFPKGFEFDEVTCKDGSKTLVPRLPKNSSNPELQKKIIKKLRVAVDGAFKVPGLRNVELTAPYMHHGGMGTLEQVVEFYNRGGNFPRKNQKDLDPDIRQLNLSEQEKKELVDFMKSLTDPRVNSEKAPFDHPELFIPVGHAERNGQLLSNDGVHAITSIKKIPAVGKNGEIYSGPPRTRSRNTGGRTTRRR